MTRTMRELMDDLDEIAGREAIVDAIMKKIGDTSVDPDVIAKWARQTVFDFARHNGATPGRASEIADRVSNRVLGEAQKR